MSGIPRSQAELSRQSRQKSLYHAQNNEKLGPHESACDVHQQDKKVHRRIMVPDPHPMLDRLPNTS